MPDAVVALGYDDKPMWYFAIAVVLATACHSDGPFKFEDAFSNPDAPSNIGPGAGGGLLTDLRFAVVGDTRPDIPDDTAHYPADIVRTIWTAVEAQAPLFAVTTGDYMFATPLGNEQEPQIDIYLGARAAFGGFVYPAMGNHECTGDTTSNCGPGNSDGEPRNYKTFITKMLGPIGETRPYFVERFAATDRTWTAKFVFVAPNAWNDDQARWLDAVLSQLTTYTFVVRHEPHEATACPGISPSNDIMARHPITLALVGHVHTYRHDPDNHELLVGNGGAPLSTAVDYGYTIISRKLDGTLNAASYHYMTGAIVDEFSIHPDGSSTP